jgi:hypothetical protein
MSRPIETEFSWLSKLGFWNCREFLVCRDLGFITVNIETLDWDLVKNLGFKLLRLLRLGFWNCPEFLDCRDLGFETVKIESLDQDGELQKCRNKLLDKVSKIVLPKKYFKIWNVVNNDDFHF